MSKNEIPDLEDDFINEPYECPECGVGKIDPIDSTCDECGFSDELEDDDYENDDEDE